MSAAPKRKRAKVPPVNGGACVYCDGKPMPGASIDPRFALCERCFAWLAAGNPMPQRGPCPKCKGNGVVDCGSCYGDGERPGGCSDCDNSGDATCPRLPRHEDDDVSRARRGDRR